MAAQSIHGDLYWHCLDGSGGSYLRTVLINHAAERVIADLRKAMYRHMMGLSTACLKKSKAAMSFPLLPRTRL